MQRGLAFSRSHHYPEVLSDGSEQSERANESASSAANSQNYLEKIFQVPFWLRNMETRAVRRLMYSLIDESERDSDFKQAELGNRKFAQAVDASSPDNQNVDELSACNTINPDVQATIEKLESYVHDAEESVDTDEEDIAPATEALTFSKAELEFMHQVAPLMSRTPEQSSDSLVFIDYTNLDCPAKDCPDILGLNVSQEISGRFRFYSRNQQNHLTSPDKCLL